MNNLVPEITRTLPIVLCSCQVAFLGRKTNPEFSLIEKEKKKGSGVLVPLGYPCSWCDFPFPLII